MPIPPLEKTWQFNVNQWMPSAATLGNPTSGITDNARVWFQIKTSLCGFASNPWLVDSSCNGTTAGTPGDGIDRWASAADVTYGSTFSWIVLRQPGVSSTFRLLLAFGPGLTYSRVTALFSVTGGFAGGTTTARPVAADEVLLLDTVTSWHSLAASDINGFNSWLHVMQSTDGECTRVLLAGVQSEALGVVNASYPGGLLLVERVKSPVAGWTHPIVAGVPRPAGTGLFLGSMLRGAAGGSVIDSQVVPLKGFHDGRTLNFTGAADGYGVSGLNVVVPERRSSFNDLTGEMELAPLVLTGELTGRQNATGPGGRGRFGTLYDLAYGSTLRLTGDVYPADGSRQRVHFGNLVVPWNGTTPRMVF